MNRVHPVIGMLIVVGLSVASVARPAFGEPPTMRRSVDGRYELTLPEAYQREPGADVQCQLRFVDNNLGLRVAVSADAKEDAVDDDLAQLEERSTEEFKRWAGGAECTDPSNLSVNGHRAIQREIRCVLSGRRYVYLVTTIETPSSIATLYCVAAPSRYDAARREFQSAVMSFREVDVPVAATGTDPSTSPSAIASTQPSVARTNDGRYEMTFPANWQRARGDDTGGYQLSHVDDVRRMRAGIRADRKDDLATDLVAYELQAVEAFRNWASDVVVGDSRSMEVNGKPAIQREIRCALGGRRLVYLCTAIETDQSLAIVYCVAPPSRFAAARAEFDSIIASFAEREAGK